MSVFLARINELVKQFSDDQPPAVILEIGSKRNDLAESGHWPKNAVTQALWFHTANTKSAFTYTDNTIYQSNLNPNFTFDNFVEGKSNQLAKAASFQVADNPAVAYNPLFLYGGVGLGKTHLMHAIGNQIIRDNPNAKVLYLHSERFVADMVKALQTNSMNEFKRYYRNVDALADR